MWVSATYCSCAWVLLSSWCFAESGDLPGDGVAEYGIYGLAAVLLLRVLQPLFDKQGALLKEQHATGIATATNHHAALLSKLDELVARNREVEMYLTYQLTPRIDRIEKALEDLRKR